MSLKFIDESGNESTVAGVSGVASTGGTKVTFTQTQTSGSEIGIISLDGVETKLYAPEGSVFAYKDVTSTVSQYQFNSDESAMQRQYTVAYTVDTGYTLVGAVIYSDTQTGTTATANLDKMWIGNTRYGGGNTLLFYIIPKWNDNNYRGHTLTFRLLFMKTS